MKAKEVHRLLALIPFLENNPGISPEAVAQRLGCSAEEVGELLNALLMCGSPPYLPDDYIGFYIDRDGIHLRFSEHFSRPIGLTLQEVLALLLLLDSVRLAQEGSLATAAVSLRQKLTDAIGSLGGEAIKPIADRLTVGQGSALQAQVVGAIETAIRESRELAIAYYSVNSDRTDRRTVRPYGLVEETGDLYLVAHCLKHVAVRTFRVDRIRSAEIQDERFERPVDFDLERRGSDPEALAAQEPIRMELRGVAADLAREALDRAVWREKGDWIELTIRSGGAPWAIRYALKFGSDAKLILPIGLREGMIETLRRIQSLYE